MSLQLIIKKFYPVKGWFTRIKPPKFFAQLDQNILKTVKNQQLSNADYHTIFNYFIEGINAYRSPEYAHILYPGVPGTRGTVVEGLEGFARVAPMLATWLHSGREPEIKLHNGETFNILTHLIHGISNGTNPEHCEYWGDITDYDQRSVEAGDIALTVWLLSEFNKNALNKEATQNIKNWLTKINFVNLYGGNWCLFKLMVNTVLQYLGEDTEANIKESYQEFKSFAVGDGWFGDGKNGFIDYYNVWQMQYYLYWFYQLLPEYDGEYLKETFSDFSNGYRYMLSPKGTPMFGRSACYRLAIATPLLINSAVNKTDYGLSKRALEASWVHYLSHAALKGGTVTQGYYSENTDILENYSGRGSSLWSLRSLTLAFYQKDDDVFWTTPPGKLPIEKSNYSVEIKGPEFTVEGNQQSQTITLHRKKTYFADKSSYTCIKQLSLFRKVLQLILRRPLREEHLNIKYGRKEYGSDNFFDS